MNPAFQTLPPASPPHHIPLPHQSWHIHHTFSPLLLSLLPPPTSHHPPLSLRQATRHRWPRCSRAPSRPSARRPPRCATRSAAARGWARPWGPPAPPGRGEELHGLGSPSRKNGIGTPRVTMGVITVHDSCFQRLKTLKGRLNHPARLLSTTFCLVVCVAWSSPFYSALTNCDSLQCAFVCEWNNNTNRPWYVPD